jgi:RES domain-containing protein
VPSALVADEFNLILNPTHPDFSRLTIGPPRPFAFDGRIWS